MQCRHDTEDAQKRTGHVCPAFGRLLVESLDYTVRTWELQMLSVFLRVSVRVLQRHAPDRFKQLNGLLLQEEVERPDARD